MGTLEYGGSGHPIRIDDYALAHLKVVITTKLRRGERFILSWQHPAGDAGGRTTIWLHPAIALRFEFDASVVPELDTAWLEELAQSANSIGGIVLSAEHIVSE